MCDKRRILLGGARRKKKKRFYGKPFPSLISISFFHLQEMTFLHWLRFNATLGGGGKTATPPFPHYSRSFPRLTSIRSFIPTTPFPSFYLPSSFFFTYVIPLVTRQNFLYTPFPFLSTLFCYLSSLFLRGRPQIYIFVIR